MYLRFDSGSLARMADDVGYDARFGAGVAKSYRRLVKLLRDAQSPQDLYALKSLHFERLKGSRSHQRSLRLNRQFRLIVELEGELIALKSIEDYH
jgi:toxin HigB-1